MDAKRPFVLLIEDNPDHAELIIRSVNQVNTSAEIKHIADGEEALMFLKYESVNPDNKTNNLPDIILLDLRLPKVDGLDLLKEIKSSEKLRKIPVVVLTSSDAEKDKLRAYNNYVNSYLVKPLDYKQFNDLINNLWKYWFNMNLA